MLLLPPLLLRSDCDALFDFLHISQANEFDAGVAGSKQVCVVQSFGLFVVAAAVAAAVAVAALVSAFLFTLTFICELFAVAFGQCYYRCFLQASYQLLRNFMPTCGVASHSHSHSDCDAGSDHISGLW